MYGKIWKSEEFVWKREGFIKKSEEFLWKNDEFVWKSERIYMAQRYSKYRFFDVNCILSILFQVQLWGCPGEPKFQFHILSGRGTLYIYIQFSGRSLFNVPRFQNSKVGKGSKVFVSHPARESTTKLLCALPFFQLVVLDVLHDFVCFLKFVIEAGKPRPSNIAGL